MMALSVKRATLWSVLVGAAWLTIYSLGRTWGSTLEERTRYLPGDDLIPDPRLTTNHATTIKATPEEIWPWLVQLGWHRGGWYTYRWVDRLLFPANRASAESILPQWQDLHVGDRIPDGPPQTDCFFVVELLEANKMLVLRSWTHLPPQLRAKNSRYQMEWSWAFYLTDLGGGETRFLFKVRGLLGPRWLRVAYHAFVVPADFVMGRSLCLGLRTRAEHNYER
ncbi:MAG TPA: hypothetical protein VHV50_09545 [Actinomycetota bacterium]|jgi:hypothetical protein|nr:hypothetical protein [Actinomycetota bacterium]